MKVLLVNKFHYLKGGSEKYYFDLAKELEKHGHEVAFFSMKNKNNIQTNNKEYFTEEIDLNSNNKLKALEIIYSRKNKKKMEEALEDFKPDIVHLNNFQRQLSASIIKPIKKRKIPIVFTAHDVQAICPAITMLDGNKKICEKCIKGKYINCIKKKCIKNSKLKSLLGAIEGKYYRIANIYRKKIDYIITPSQFYKSKFIEDGIPEEKIKALHNFINIDEYKIDTKDDNYALYFGRLSKEKGILHLIDAFSKMKDGKLYIAGEGEEKENIKKLIENNGLEDRIKLLGFLNTENMKEYIRKCKFVIVPSIWYENCPYSIIETLAIGKPVIGSNMGGIPELIKNGENGFIYQVDNINDLKQKIQKLFNDNDLVKKFSEKSKELCKKLYSKEIYYNELIKIYNSLLNR